MSVFGFASQLSGPSELLLSLLGRKGVSCPVGEDSGTAAPRVHRSGGGAAGGGAAGAGRDSPDAGCGEGSGVALRTDQNDEA